MADQDETEDWPDIGPDFHAMVGRRIGQFTIERVLGSGACGVVFAAIDAVTRRRVALKMLDPRQLPAQQQEMLLNEARKAASLSHPNIAAVHHAALSPPHIVFEYVDGQNLAKVIESEAPLPPLAAARVAADVASALAHAHQNIAMHDQALRSQILFQGREGRLGLVGQPLSGSRDGRRLKTDARQLVKEVADLAERNAQAIFQIDGQRQQAGPELVGRRSQGVRCLLSMAALHTTLAIRARAAFHVELRYERLDRGQVGLILLVDLLVDQRRLAIRAIAGRHVDNTVDLVGRLAMISSMALFADRRLGR